MELQINDWGLIPYADAWKEQEVLFNGLVQAKQNGESYINIIITC